MHTTMGGRALCLIDFEAASVSSLPQGRPELLLSILRRLASLLVVSSGPEGHLVACTGDFTWSGRTTSRRPG